ncbi:MAG TPA: selenocysteine-specific translation elongation factor [Planctomycetes bacterium]|nr:selenocysteine-specific translation elongation factor [Planctomycetota bacterium]
MSDSSGVRIHPVIVGTAGHVDHGKSSLVRRLTGVDPDRLREEKERGLTIDLGFAPLELPSGRLVGIVDVPGHEKFLKNMVAGATSIDFALLVVAADDGVMPQTLEHLDVLNLLGVKKGMVLLTKIDLVDDELLELAELGVREAVEGSCFEEAPILKVSSQTMEGIPELIQALDAEVSHLEPRSAEGLFRLPVQRVFSKPGFGTILTGIPLAGSIAVGDRLEVVGRGLESRVRAIQAYGSQVERARAGHSTALNLPGIPVEQVRRGDVLAQPGVFERTQKLELSLQMVKGVAPLTHGEEVHLHIGTLETMARVFLLDKRELGAGEKGIAQVFVREPVTSCPGDLLLLRRMSPARTLAGGRVLGTFGRRLRRFKDPVLEHLREKEKSLGSPRERLLLLLSEAGAAGMSREIASGRLGWTLAELEAVLASIREDGGQGEAIVEEAKSGLLFHPASVAREIERIQGCLQGWYAEHPLSSTVPLSLVREGAPGRVLQPALDLLASRGDLRFLPGGLLQDPSREDRLNSGERARLKELQAFLEEAGTRPHSPAAVRERFGPEGESLLEALLEMKGAVLVGRNFVWGREAFDKALQAAAQVCGNKVGGVLEIPKLRDLLGTSRKFLMPLLEHMDRSGVTARKGDRRILRKIPGNP